MSDTPFTIHQYTLGPWGNLMYLIEDKATGECAVVDPAWDIHAIEEQIAARGLTPTHCLITHNHFDHINMLAPLLARRPGLTVHMLDIEVEWSKFDCPGLVPLSVGQQARIGRETVVKALHTPGHSPGSISYQLGGCLLTGDAVFIDSCGRADFVGGDCPTLYRTINWIKENLPDETVIYPGHGTLERGSDTLANQKKTNPYFLFETYEEFEAKRMDGYTPGSSMPDISPEWQQKIESLQPT